MHVCININKAWCPPSPMETQSELVLNIRAPEGAYGKASFTNFLKLTLLKTKHVLQVIDQFSYWRIEKFSFQIENSAFFRWSMISWQSVSETRSILLLQLEKQFSQHVCFREVWSEEDWRIHGLLQSVFIWYFVKSCW